MGSAPSLLDRYYCGFGSRVGIQNSRPDCTNLNLLEDPHALYLNASDEIRRKLNQAIFKHIFVANEKVVGDEINSPSPN